MDKENVYVVCVHTHTHRKNEILPFMTLWMDLEGLMLSYINQRKTNIYDLIYMQNLKNNKNKNEAHRYREQFPGCQSQVGWKWWLKWVKEIKSYKLSVMI